MASLRYAIESTDRPATICKCTREEKKKLEKSDLFFSRRGVTMCILRVILMMGEHGGQKESVIEDTTQL